MELRATDQAVSDLPPHSPTAIDIESFNRLLDIVQNEARDADDKAAAACRRSKYSVQDYFMCIEFKMQRLHDSMAKEAGLARRSPIYPFRAKLTAFKKTV